MRLKFDRNRLATLVASLPAADSEILVVKDDGIYLMSFAQPKEGRTVVYARGYDPRRDGDVWDKCRIAVGGDDIGEKCGTRAQFAEALDASDGDIIVDVTESRIKVVYRTKMSGEQKAARIAALSKFLTEVQTRPQAQWSPRLKRNVKKYTKELAALTEDASMQKTIDGLLEKSIKAHPEHAAEFLAAKKRNAGLGVR